MIWLQFALCAAVIFFAGSKLSLCGEQIAVKGALGKNFVGLVLLAAIASSSQLIAGVSAVTLHDLPDLAVGAYMGSCMFNMLMIGLLDFFSRNRPVSHRVKPGHILSAGFGIVLVSFAAIDILFGKRLPVLTLFHSMDPITFLFIPVYLLAMRLIYRYERSRQKAAATEQTGSHVAHQEQSWARLIFTFSVCAILIVATSSYLPELADQIQKATGWGQSFIGLSFIAITTCMPEIAVSTSAARRASFDVAVASLLGSNLFYMVALAITDFCYLKEPLLRHVSSSNALAAMTAVVSMAIVIIALTYRAEKKPLILAGDAAALIFMYVFANVLLFGAN